MLHAALCFELRAAERKPMELTAVAMIDNGSKLFGGGGGRGESGGPGACMACCTGVCMRACMPVILS